MSESIIWKTMCDHNNCLAQKPWGQKYCVEHDQHVTRFGSLVLTPTPKPVRDPFFCGKPQCKNLRRVGDKFCMACRQKLTRHKCTPTATNMKTTDQLNPNTYTARERAIARAAFLDGVATCWHKGALGEPARLARWHDASLGAAAAKYEKKARAAFPAPPVTRPRVIVDRVASVAYRYVDGLLQQTNNVNDPHGANVRWITAIAIFARMIDQINALAADPTETVTDDEDGG